MDWIHELFIEGTGAQLNIGVDCQKLVLEMEFIPLSDERISNELRGSFSCSSLEELCELYSSKMRLVFAPGNPFINIDGNEELPVDLMKLCRASTKRRQARRSPTKDEAFARQCLEEVLIRRKDDSAVNNLVFYWNDDYCEGIYLNNTRLNGVSDTKVKKHIQNTLDWLDGEFVVATLPPTPGRGSKLPTHEDCQSYMYKICALLEARRCFGLFSTPEDFRAFAVWHDEENDVDFNLRKSLSRK